MKKYNLVKVQLQNFLELSRTLSSTKTMEEQNATPSTAHECFIDPTDFDPERLILKDPETSNFTMGQSEVSVTMAEGRYLNDEDQECLLYFSAPSQQCFGVQYIYDMDIKEADQTPDKAKGFQIAYPLTSMKTIDNPTEEEQAYIDMLDSLWDAAVEQGRAEAEKDEPLIPGVAVNSFIAAERTGKWEQAVKRPAEHPKTKDKKSFDTTKPKRQYTKLFSSGKGETLNATTPFYGPGNKKYNAIKYLSKRGVIEPCFHFEGVYYGSHGPRAPHGASLRFRLAEANYVETSGNSALPSKKMLRKNTAKDFSTGHEEEEDNGHEDGTFESPNETPTAKLNKLGKKTPGKAKVAVKKTTGAKAKPATKKVVPVKAKVSAKKTTAAKKSAPTKAAPVKKTKPVKKVVDPEPSDDEEIEEDESE